MLDTNILVSALLSSKEDSATVQVVSRLFSGDFCPLLSRDILTEYRDVLRRPKFGFSETIIEAMLAGIEDRAQVIEPTPSGELLPDMKDLPFYEVVLEKKDAPAYLVTGNMKHFPEKPFIVTAREFLELLDRTD